MLKYAKIINETTKEVSIAIGSNPPFNYKQIEVDKAYNGNWYVAGYAPEKPESIVKQERIDELKENLINTDYKAIKFAEGWYSDEEYAPVKEQRETWREEIRELEDAEKENDVADNSDGG